MLRRYYSINFIIAMGKIQHLVILSVLLLLTFSQTVNLSQIYTPETLATLGPEYNDPNFIKLIDNYFGCKTWTDGNCAECSSGYVFNKNGVCCVVDQHCQQFNTDVGICENCYTGYSVSTNGSCVVAASSPANNGCAQWEKNLCVKCSVRFYFNADQVCTAVSDHCRDWNSNGECTSCYYGYSVANVSCVQDATQPIAIQSANNPLCSKWEGSSCVACAFHSYLNGNGICTAVSDFCNTWDKLDGSCLSCYRGYDLVNGTCVEAQSAPLTDAGCKTWVEGVCKECSNNWVFNANSVCIPVSDLCRTYDAATGDCLTCYRGYDLINGSCLYSESNNIKPTDGGCKTWDWENKVCVACSDRWVADDNGICVPVNDLCRTSTSKGVCESCYRGYDLVDGSCVWSPSNSAPLPDAGCKIWNWTANACSVCSHRWVLAKSGSCAEVSDLCSAYSEETGFCSACYAGYDLENGVCLFSPSNTAAPADAGCAKWVNGACESCSFGWVFNAKGQCAVVSDQCKTYDVSTGDCLTCYRGYDLINGSCLYSESNNAKPTDGGCKTWDWANAKCVACSDRWVADDNGICVPVNDLCRTSTSKGACESCYRGYDLFEGACVWSPSNSAALPDSGCKIWNWTANACEVCSQGWYFLKGVCTESSTLCKSFEASNGACLSCYLGYDLVNGTCLFSSSNVAPPTDPGCHKWADGVCSACSEHWAFNSNNVCTAVSDLCKTNEGLDCTSCYNGYALENGTCVLSNANSFPTDAGCAKWNWADQTCLACSTNWFSSNGVCVPVNPQCKTHDSSNGDCLTCYKGYKVVNGSCVAWGVDRPADVGCADWNWDDQVCLSCSKYFVLVNGTCQAVSSSCKTYDASGACTACFTGYALSNGVCSVSQTTCKTQDDNGACLTCYNGFALYKGQCVNLSNLANIALYYAACCPEKLAQLQAEGRIPK